MKSLQLFLLLFFVGNVLSHAMALDQLTKVNLTIEEQRVDKAQQVMPVNIHYFAADVFKSAWPKVTNYQAAKQLLANLGDDLWSFAKHQVQTGKLVDDRPLYWSRLALKRFIKQTSKHFSDSELIALLEVFERHSRGYRDLAFSQATDKKILLTGFDPFLLDRNIKQSNPSGLTALLLDGVVIEYQQGDKKITAEINTAMIPVRFEDFDQGEIESLLAPFYATNRVDMIATISMGRSNFDLEHFPGLRRSSKAPDNLNIYSGADLNKPIIPLLTDRPLVGEEFVEYSLPFQAMMQAKGHYKINDNRGVTVLRSGKATDIIALILAELRDRVSLQGGGGGYLSNEISYRSIRLKNLLQSTIPTGHIHTPSINDFDQSINKKITAQIEAMLILALAEI